MYRDLVTGNWNVTFSTNQNIEEALQTFSGKEMDVKLKQHREKRSLDANAYYWCLLTKLARIHGWSNAEAHNRMLRDYGQYERVEGQLIAVQLPDTDQTEREILNKMEYHLALSPKITIMKGLMGLYVKRFFENTLNHSSGYPFCLSFHDRDLR